MDKRKRLVYILGATGGVGAALVAYLNQTNTGELQICCLQRKDVNSDEKNKIIKYDLLDSDETELFQWTNDQVNMFEVMEVVLVLCAGTITPLVPLTKVEDDELEKHIAVNLKGQIFLIKRIAVKTNEMKVPLRIIHFDSGAAYHPIAGWGLYCSAKAYLSMYLHVLNKENPEHKIVLVDPGVIDTKMQADIRKTPNTIFPDVETFIHYKENNELKKPEEVAREIAERYIFNWTATNIKERLL